MVNGSELEEDEEIDRGPTEWNSAFFKLLACSLPGLTTAQIDEMAITPITSLPYRSAFDVITSFLRDVDAVYFNDHALGDAQAVQVRTAFAAKIMRSRAWARHVRDRSTSTEIHFGPAIAVLLFNDYWGFQPPKCYLFAKAIDRVDPFLPLLKEIAEGGQFFLAAITMLNLLEVAPRSAHLPVIVAAGKSWLSAFRDDKGFWIEQGIGRRLCSLLHAIFSSDAKAFESNPPLREEIDALLGSLVPMGIPEARRLEENLLSIARVHPESA